MGPIQGLTDLITVLKNLVSSSNQINQTLSSAFPLWTAGQIPGTTTNGDATAGNIGEYVNSSIDSGSAISLTTATPADVTSISLTGGDWDVWGSVGFIANAATTSTIFTGAVSLSSATLPTPPAEGSYAEFGLTLGAGETTPLFPTGMRRVSVASTTTVYLVAQSTFAVNTMDAYGFLGARRRR